MNNAWVLFVSLFIFLELAALPSSMILATSKSKVMEVKISAVQFIPPTISIKNGDTVQWVNEDKLNHTISSIFFKSNVMYPVGSKKYASTFNFTFNRPGIYVYFDRLHPNTGGVVYVNSSETQRELIPTSVNAAPNVKVEMPQNSAYLNVLGSFFIPSFLNVTEGAKVTWTNKDYIPHTATAADGSFDTKPILNGKSVTEVMKTLGVYAYYCEIHPWMLGAVQITKAA